MRSWIQFIVYGFKPAFLSSCALTGIVSKVTSMLGANVLKHDLPFEGVRDPVGNSSSWAFSSFLLPERIPGTFRSQNGKANFPFLERKMPKVSLSLGFQGATSILVLCSQRLYYERLKIKKRKVVNLSLCRSVEHISPLRCSFSWALIFLIKCRLSVRLITHCLRNQWPLLRVLLFCCQVYSPPFTYQCLKSVINY